jgi:hypothetical protein
MVQPPQTEGNSKMKNTKRIYIAILTAALLVAGKAAHAKSAQQTGDQTKTDLNTTKPTEKKSADSAPRQ